jgi:hypothetical protein
MVTLAMLANWRTSRQSERPPYTEIGRTILYRLDLLEDWECARAPVPLPLPESVT